MNFFFFFFFSETNKVLMSFEEEKKRKKKKILAPLSRQTRGWCRLPPQGDDAHRDWRYRLVYRTWLFFSSSSSFSDLLGWAPAARRPCFSSFLFDQLLSDIHNEMQVYIDARKNQRGRTWTEERERKKKEWINRHNFSPPSVLSGRKKERVAVEKKLILIRTTFWVSIIFNFVRFLSANLSRRVVYR